jgi:hypothetical protein
MDRTAAFYLSRVHPTDSSRKTWTSMNVVIRNIIADNFAAENNLTIYLGKRNRLEQKRSEDKNRKTLICAAT